MTDRDVRQMSDEELQATLAGAQDLAERCQLEIDRRAKLDAELKAATDAAKARQS